MGFIEKFIDTTDKDITAILPIKDRFEDAFLLTDGTILDMVSLNTKDLLSLSFDEQFNDNVKFANFYKTYPGDCKIVCFNFPTETKSNQAYYRKKIDTTMNPVFKQLLEEKLSQLEWVEKNRTQREYYLFFFATDAEDYHIKVNAIAKALESNRLASYMSFEKKKKIIFKLNNKNASIFV